MRSILKVVFPVVLFPIFGFAQSLSELQALAAPRSLELSSDGSRLWYQLGQTWWEVGTGPSSSPTRLDSHEVAGVDNPPEVQGTRRLSSPRQSPDGKKLAYLDAEDPYGPSLLFCFCGKPPQDDKLQLLSRMPILEFQWARDSESFWVITVDGADERFEQTSKGAALRRRGGLVVANGVVAWVQSDGSHFGTIWVRDRAGTSRMLVNPNPQIAKWNLGTQEVIRWRNSHREELQGILAKPSRSGHLPLIVDPYSSWRNSFLNIPVLGNYIFVKEGFAVFFPDHRAPHTFPASSFGEAYVGKSKDRDPIDVLVDDVMTGDNELIRDGVADPDRLFLYSSSNGASAINQLLTGTRAFRAAVSHAGVSDWPGYYQERRPLGDETIPSFLGGRKPEDSPELYRRISPIYQADKITTPLLLVIGEKDTRFRDTMKFYEALRKSGNPVNLVTYPGERHEIVSSAVAEQHVQTALEFFRSVVSTK